MRRYSIVALLLGLLVVAAPFTRNTAFAADDEDDDEENDVVDITSKNFDSIVKGSKYALVAFTAPWCGHCKTLKPQWAKAATALKSYEPKIVIANVDATAESEMANKYEVKGYPTIKWFVNGELASDYNGPRDADGIVGWLKKKTGPWAVEVDSADKLAALEKDNQVLFVAYFAKPEGPEFDALKGVAEKVEGVAFAYTTDAAVAKSAGLETAGSLAAVKNFVGEDREVVAFTESFSVDAVDNFVKAEKMPLTIEFSQANSEKIFNSGIPKQIIYWSGADGLTAESESFKALRTVAKQLKGKMVFVTSNTDGDSHEPITNYFGLKGETGPVILGFWMEKNRKYRYEGEVTAEALSAFAESILDGTAQATFKSAPIPAEPTEDGVTIVVGKNFDNIVLDSSKDVLLEVYAPWCGHCKKLTPIYAKLAKRFKNIDSVVIAKMDGTENEHAQVEAKGYPTILFYPAGEDKTPITFEGGDRSLKALTKFIKEKAKIPYELAKKQKDEKEEAGAAESKDEL